MAFVEQEPPSPSDVTVSDALLGITQIIPSGGSSVSTGGLMSVYEAVRQYRLASLNASDDPDGFATAAQKMDATNGWAVLTKADEVSTRLRVKHLEDQPLSSLSGGERKRVALAAALVQEPDVLILGKLVEPQCYCVLLKTRLIYSYFAPTTDEPTNHLDLAGECRNR